VWADPLDIVDEDFHDILDAEPTLVGLSKKLEHWERKYPEPKWTNLKIKRIAYHEYVLYGQRRETKAEVDYRMAMAEEERLRMLQSEQYAAAYKKEMEEEERKTWLRLSKKAKEKGWTILGEDKNA
jgi:hypothetical protein